MTTIDEILIEAGLAPAQTDLTDRPGRKRKPATGLAEATDLTVPLTPEGELALYARHKAAMKVIETIAPEERAALLIAVLTLPDTIG